ncbi:MAG: transposase [Desulfohalobiaceae bacterium]
MSSGMLDTPEITGNVQRVFRSRHKIDNPDIISHITQRAAGKEPLFIEDNDYLTMLGLLKESAERFEITYYALCLMPNHIHILIEPRQKNLAQAMRHIFFRYATKFNQKYEQTRLPFWSLPS